MDKPGVDIPVPMKRNTNMSVHKHVAPKSTACNHPEHAFNKL